MNTIKDRWKISVFYGEELRPKPDIGKYLITRQKYWDTTNCVPVNLFLSN